MSEVTICVVGNPNCGKTTLFNALTGSRQDVGNWPGVTVEKKVGAFRHGEASYRLVDLPGIYSLDGGRSSEDERVARDFILSGEAAVVVNIVDAANLERNLYLTSQLLEMGVPMVVAVNMIDVARARRITVDIDRLAADLGCPAVVLVASRKHGLDGLKAAIGHVAAERSRPAVRPVHAEAVEQALTALEPALADVALRHRFDERWLGLKLLEGDPQALTLAGPAAGSLDVHLEAITAATGEDADIIIADGRYGFVGGVVAACVHRGGMVSRTVSDRIDRVVLDRFLGIPIFFFMMYLMFMATINVGGAFVDFFDQAVGALLVDGLGTALGGIGAPEAVTVLLANGVGGGIQTVATFIPIIGFLYLFLSFLEDSGYMARAAFVMDRGMRAIGLPGKAFVPLIVGFGCNVPSIMATRTLEHRRDRILTVMMAPFMSCGARLPVYILVAAAFFPADGQNVVFALYLIGLVIAIGTGLLLRRTWLAGEAAPFVMELPPYHLPTFETVVRRAWHRLSDFVFRAGRVIVPMVVVLSFLNSVGTDGSFGHQNSDRSVLAKVGQSITPVFRPMGMTDDNWPAAVGLFTGVFAKEAVVGTLNALYAGGGAAEEKPFDLGERLTAAALTIPTNLGEKLGAYADPLGLDVGFIADAGEAAEKLKVDGGVFAAMTARFAGAAGAFAYLLLILLYMPCLAATGAILQETGWRWTLFSAVWGTGLGYCLSVLFYQVATFGANPLTSGLWIAGGLGTLALAAAAMVVTGRAAAPVAQPAG